LVALLSRMNYAEQGGVWHHPERKAIFLGDFIDRGPRQLETVTIARNMVENNAAFAVLGNHELNAIAWHTPDPDNPGDFMRSHFSEKYGEKNRAQHEKFLAEVEHNPALHKEIIDWFLTLPLWLDLPGLRVVHACWHQSFMNILSPLLVDVAQATRKPLTDADKDNATPSVFKAVEALTKGIEIPLAKGDSFLDKDGIKRFRVRVRWWDKHATTYRLAALLSEAEMATLSNPDAAIPEHARIKFPTDKPIFFGHYWMTGTCGAPGTRSAIAACVDYSAGKGGPLVAYRWDGESTPDNAKFIASI
jgi:Calcineurin-like phosphoesterase